MYLGHDIDMHPQVPIITPTIINPYIPPDDLSPTELIDYELGGIGLSNASQGLQIQTWTLQVLGTGINTAIYLSAPNTPSTFIFTLPQIVWARLAFDQNMHPTISFMYENGAGYWWYDPTIPGNTVVTLPATVYRPCVTLDDKRAVATTLGTSDVVLAYINGTNLCYRLQRDRYGTEYVWVANVTNYLITPFVNKIGMDTNWRLLLDVRGSLYA